MRPILYACFLGCSLFFGFSSTLQAQEKRDKALWFAYSFIAEKLDQYPGFEDQEDSQPWSFELLPSQSGESRRLMFREVFTEKFSNAKWRQFLRSSADEVDLPKSLKEYHESSASLRMLFSTFEKLDIYLVEVQLLRPRVTNPKIAVDGQVIKAGFFLFVWDGRGELEQVFYQKLDPYLEWK